MKRFLGLILVAGLLVAGWVNRDKLSGLWAKAGPALEGVTDSSSSPPTATAALAPAGARAATPHPAREAQAQALIIYPALALSNSALNKKFVALHQEAQASNSALLTRPDWPLQLAERAVVAIGGSPMGRSTPAGRNTPASLPARSRKQVVVYTTSHCPYCVKAKEYLTQKGVSYREVNIETSSSGKAEYRKLGGTGTPLIIVGSTKVDGFDAAELDRLL